MVEDFFVIGASSCGCSDGGAEGTDGGCEGSGAGEEGEDAPHSCCCGLSVYK